jgi:hypothetical protein
MMDRHEIVAATRRWIARVVIGLNMCPFARRVFEGDKIRYAVTLAEDEQALRQELARELEALAAAPCALVETTLLIHPCVLRNFLDYNEFLDGAERLLAELGLAGTLQIASFHPDYQFAGTDAGAVENHTNRSPYPMLHLLREASISAVAGDPGELLEIPRRNIETLRRLGIEGIREMLQEISLDRDGRPERKDRERSNAADGEWP